MATQGYGLVIYSDDIYNINKQNGLTNDIVSEVHIENDTTIWACTNTGLNRISFKKDKTYIITTITKDDGLLSNDIDDVEIINDTVWVATKKGLCYFKKDILEQKNASKIISLTLKKTTINSKTLTKKKAKLNYNQNNISFTLQAISHNNSNKINYLYRLKEIDTTWSKTTNRKIRFPSLAPRNYTFQAKAEIGNSISKQQINYTFVIKPPFWKSWWFYCLCTLLLCGLIYLFFKIRVLTYNKDIIRELMRVAIKRIKREEQFYNFRANGEDFKIPTKEIQYINSQGNYLDIITDKKNYTIRCKIGDFIATTPDALEYLRVHRSYIIRIEKVSSKGKNWVVIKDKKIPVGETYLNTLNRIQF
nr:LytTR family DNA-binding domain-containing protein [Polaribacter porphyrae]